MAVNRQNNPESIEDIIEQLNSDVFSKEHWIQTNFYKIPEITYSYNYTSQQGPFLNLTLFRDLGDLDESKYYESSSEEKAQMLEQAEITVKEKINDKIDAIKSFIESIDNLADSDDIVTQNRVKIIRGGLLEVIDTLRMALVSLPLEREKALIGHHFLSNAPIIEEKERAGILEEINGYNHQLFKSKLSDDDGYVEGTLNYYHTELTNYDKAVASAEITGSRVFTAEEKSRFEGYLKKLSSKVAGFTPKVNDYAKSVISDELSKTVISYDKAREVFNRHFSTIEELTGNMPHTATMDKDIRNVTDTPDGISLPLEVNAAKPLNLKRMFELLGHEIEQHSVTIVKHMELVGNVRGERNVELAEGAAMLNEDLFKYGRNLLKDATDVHGNPVKIIDIEKLEYESNFPGTVMMEILSDEEFLDFLKLSQKVTPNKNSPLDRFLRLKRNGFQMKDAIYNVGREKAVKYYNDIILGKFDGEFSDLFLAKVGFHQIEDVKAIKDELLLRNNSLDESQKVKLPETIMFHELLYYSLKKKLESTTQQSNEILADIVEGFYHYLQEKYPFMDFVKDKLGMLCRCYNKQVHEALDITNEAVEAYRRQVSNEAMSIISKK